jgi:hypothetical protein
MLTVFLMVLPALLTPGNLGLGIVDGSEGLLGITLADGARRPLLGVLGADLEDDGMLPVLFRDFEIGKAGRAMFGGPCDGRDGRGSVVDMVVGTQLAAVVV